MSWLPSWHRPPRSGFPGQLGSLPLPLCTLPVKEALGGGETEGATTLQRKINSPGQNPMPPDTTPASESGHC